MGTDTYTRQFYRGKPVPQFAVLVAVIAFLAVAGNVAEIRAAGPTAIAAVSVVAVTAVVVGGWGARTLLDYRPRLTTDRHGLTVPFYRTGPLELLWEEITDVSMNEGFGARLLITVAGGTRHSVSIIMLDKRPAEIFDHVSKCHAALGTAEQIPADNSAAAPGAKEPGARPVTGTRTFRPKPQFPIDPRVIGIALAALGAVGAVAAFTMGDEPGVIRDDPTRVLAVVSVLGCMTGVFLTIPTVRRYGWAARPRRGWPRLTVGTEGITYYSAPDDELHIPWERVRKIVRLTTRFNNGEPILHGLKLYYLADDNEANELHIELYEWDDPEGVRAALTARDVPEE